jgi:hypothetical protein
MQTAWIVFLAGCGFQAQLAAPDATSGTSAAPDDAFTFAECPASYDVALPGPSHYRLIKEGHRAWEQSDACNRDVVGATHLVVVENLQELTDIANFVDSTTAGIAGDAVWIGGVQRPTAATPRDAWYGFDGALLFDGWGAQEPNDHGGDESDHEEQFVKIQKTRHYFTDSSGNESDGALCECDGKPPDASAAQPIAGYRR